MEERGGKGDRYKAMKKEYRGLCEEKMRKKRENWKRGKKEVRTKGQVWRIMNRERKRR